MPSARVRSRWLHGMRELRRGVTGVRGARGCSTSYEDDEKRRHKHPKPQLTARVK